jgi:copper chaperone NosL
MTASRGSRLMIAGSAILLATAILFPLWRVSLLAPQYPEGLGMYIWAHTVAGVGPNDLQNINGLNHYIGMKAIVPESIPELKIMRPGILAMSALGLVVAALGRRRLLFAWSGALLFAALVGLADFWRWEYDYGHDLDLENAPIQVPGMTYQPPLIGSKKLLNFTATSLPATGGVLAISAVFLAAFAAVRERRSPRTMTRTAATIAVAGAVACGGGPRALVPGQDACNYCRMSIDDVRYGALVETAKGKIETFDSIECLASYVTSLPADAAPRRVLVADFDHPDVWLEAASARFLHEGSLKSPMGRELAAFPADSAPASLAARFGGRTIAWSEVLALATVQRSAGHAHAH